MSVVGIHPEELLDKLLDGELLPAERERLRAHLAVCEVCRFEQAARQDFHEEALTLSAPPALPLRPLQLGPSPVSAAPRRRRSRRLVWGLAAAALITASGAVASNVSGAAWRAVAWLAPTATPVERSAPTVVAKRLPSRTMNLSRPVSAPVVSAPVVSAPVVSAPVVSAPVVSAPVVSVKVSSREFKATVREPEVSPVAPAAPSTADMLTAKDAATEAPTAVKLFGDANQARRAGDVGRASGLYRLLQDRFPGSPEAELSRVTLALLLLDNGDAQGALNGFERYLAGNSRGLEAEALVGRARALGRLGRRELEVTAWREVQRRYPQSIYGRQAGERLLALGQP